MGYSGGSTILPWYTPPSNSESGGPRTEKCHSKRLSCSKQRVEMRTYELTHQVCVWPCSRAAAPAGEDLPPAAGRGSVLWVPSAQQPPSSASSPLRNNTNMKVQVSTCSSTPAPPSSAFPGGRLMNTPPRSAHPFFYFRLATDNVSIFVKTLTTP